MKLLLITCLSFLLLTSCDRGDTPYYKYKLLNNSDYSISINIFNKKNRSFVKSFELKSKGDIWDSENNIKGINSGAMLPHLLIGGDSVVIFFNEVKKATNLYKASNYSTFDILEYDNYEKIIVDGDIIFTYTFTNEDYNNAEEIGGG